MLYPSADALGYAYVAAPRLKTLGCEQRPRYIDALIFCRDAYKFTQTLFVCVYFSSASRP